jgi:glycosyltransferase involved in cell wall biosynthesis
MSALARRFRRSTPIETIPEDFLPIRVVDVEATAPLTDIDSTHDGRLYGGAWILVRAHGEPVGVLEVPLEGDGISADELASNVEEAAGAAVARHLAADGIAPAQDDAHEDHPARPGCEVRRETFHATAPFVSVVIPSRDRAERLARCMDVIFAGDYPSTRFEVVVADNVPSNDDTRRMVAEMAAAGRNVKYVRENRPGSASARNRGLLAAEGDIVAFADDDVRVDPRWLTQLIRGFGAAEDVACVSGSILPMELETPAQVWFEHWGGFTRQGFETRIFDLTEHRAESVLYPYSPGIYGAGGNMAFRSAAIREIGGFDPALGNGTPALGGTDIDALLRIVLGGMRLVHEPTAAVHHPHYRTVEGLRRQMYCYGAGLTATLLKTALSDRRHAVALARRVPQGAWFAVSPTSAKNVKKHAGFPRFLSRREFEGMAYGPIAYARSRHQIGPQLVPMPPVPDR